MWTVRVAGPRVRGGRGLFCWAILLAWLTGCGTRHEVSDGVQLVLRPANLEPTTTFELRFDAPMVLGAEVGRRNVNSPLRIQPAIEGDFVWLSQRSGVYTPSEASRLGTLYRLSLAPGLTRADGHPSTARLLRFLRTPALQVIAPRDSGSQGMECSPVPQLQLAFNANVRAAEAGRWMYFRSADVGEVPAEVRQSSAEEFLGYQRWVPWPLVGTGLPLTWRQRFELSRQPGSTNPPPGLWLEPGRGLESPVAHALTVLPARMLPPGRGWELVIEPGLSSSETSARLPARFILPVGHVVAFEVKSAAADSGLNSGRKVLIEFAKPLAPELDPVRVLDWIAVLPAPTNLSAAINGSFVVLRGGFQLGRPYQVTVRPGLPAGDGMKTAQEFTAPVAFSPLPPRLYFPEFVTDQLSEGRREFPLLALNADRVLVRAKLIDPAALVHALRGYGSYFQGPAQRRVPGEDFSGLDFNLLPGRTVFTREFTVSNRVDEAARVRLDWDEVLGEGGRGAVFVEAEHEARGSNGPVRIGTQAMVQLTDLGLVWKRSPAHALVHLFSYTSGKAIPNGQIELRSAENQTLGQASTDAAGLARLSTPTNAGWLVARVPGDARAAELRRDDLPAYALGLSWEHVAAGAANPRRALMFTDRPVYRGGETVHWKALVREWRGGRLDAPVGGPIRLRCFNARDQVFLETNLVITAAGAVDHDILLPRVCQGEYRAELSWDDTVFIHQFLVRDYRPNSFEIELSTRPVYAAGEPVRVGVTARYLLGQSLSQGRIEWSLELADAGFQPEGYDGFRFCGAGSEVAEGGSPPLGLHGRVEFAGSSNCVIAPELPSRSSSPQPRRGEVLVELTDLNQQSLARQAEFLQHSSSFYLGLPESPDVRRAGDNLAVTVVAVGADGRPWPEPVVAEVRLEQVRWRTVRIETAGRVLGYKSERETTVIGEQELPTSGLRRLESGWEVDPAKTTTGAFPLEAAGQYRLIASSRDPDGRAVATEQSLYVYGREALAWDYRNEVQLGLVADAPRYRAGDTATILVKAPFHGEALVTVERETVLRSFVTRLEGNAPAVQVPLEAGDAPNVFVSVLLLRGAADNPKGVKMPEYRGGYLRLEVEAPETRLEVSVQPQAVEYRPGAPVQVLAEVRDHSGQPVPGAELTVFAVDEGVLNLTGFATPDPHGHFFMGEPLAVETGITLSRLLPEDPGALRFQNKGYVIGGGGRGHARQHFLACAFWSPSLVTDAAGQVRVEFGAPDNLTRYRIMAVAHTLRGQFGHGEATFEVNKPLMIEPALPSFARVGDRLVARAVVVNRMARTGAVEVVLRLDQHAAAGAPASALGAGVLAVTNLVSLGATSAAAVDVPVEFLRAGTAAWTWSAQWLSGAGEAAGGSRPSAVPTEADSVRSTVAVGYPVPELREVHLARVRQGESNLLAAVNPQLLEGEGAVTVRVSATRLGELGEAVAQLLHYPYGCVEQTASSLLPWLVLNEAAATWLRTTNRAAEVRQAIAGGVDRLLSLQTFEGGLAYWPGGHEANVWGSAYGAMALTLAQRRGFGVNRAAFESLLVYLREQLEAAANSNASIALTDRALVLYALALAGKAVPTHYEPLFDRRAGLSRAGRAWLALALIESGGPADRAEELLRTQTPETAADADAFSSLASAVGVHLLAWSRLHPEAPEVDLLVAELTQAMREGHWSSTQGNAWALLALAEYARRVEGDARDAAGVVLAPAATEPFGLTASAPSFERVYAWGADSVPTHLSLRATGEAPLFAQMTVEARPRVWEQPRQDRGLRIQRTYHRLDDQNRLLAPEDLEVGHRVLVSITVEVRQPSQYVAVDDPLPCVLEAINSEFPSQAIRASAALGQDWVSSHRELRADRAVFFCNRLAPGAYTVRYLARVRAAGDVSTPAAKVEEMYHPERFGLTETGRVRVRSN